MGFPSTHLIRDATSIDYCNHPSCGVSIHTSHTRCDKDRDIYIHASYKECDAPTRTHMYIMQIYIHAPVRGATLEVRGLKSSIIIYIHASRERCDIHRLVYQLPTSCLHPRTSWEVRQTWQQANYRIFWFTSTHLVRGATARYSVSRYIFTISCIRFSGLHLCIPQEVRLQDILVRTFRDFLVYFGFAQIS